MKEGIAILLKKTLKEIGVNAKDDEILRYIEIPPSGEVGDYAFPCFFLSKILKKNPNEIAEEIAERIEKKDFEKVKAVNGYVNFFINKIEFSQEIVKKILREKDKFGKGNVGKGKKVLIEYSQANTHKAFHVGHIRGTSIGESLSRIMEFLGKRVVRVNYQGDMGMHVAKWIWCYSKYYSKEKLKNDESWIARIYVDAVKRLEGNEELQEEVNEINRKLEGRKDKKLNGVWKKTRKFSLKSLERVYRELDARFDKYYFESEMEKDAKEISANLLKKKIAKI